MRLLAGLALVLGALLTVVNASAYQMAAVTNRPSLTVVATGSAALALRPGPTTLAGNAAATAYTAADGRLILDFTRGYGQASGYGFAAGQQYRFRRVFEVDNAADGARAVTVYVPGGGISGLAGIYGRTAAAPAPDGTQLALAGGQAAAAYTLGAGETLYVDVWWDYAGGSASPPFTIRVEAAKV